MGTETAAADTPTGEVQLQTQREGPIVEKGKIQGSVQILGKVDLVQGGQEKEPLITEEEPLPG
ncbi:MAG: hypothetical protein BWY86_01318 [Candidatus Aminicenantes bacterium ADurb.Bin508]|nr:MAG: hypothetical protein BWY86_01318 [Candidatus Aminicenantes bacterium ADurb.Bin508]